MPLIDSTDRVSINRYENFYDVPQHITGDVLGSPSHPAITLTSWNSSLFAFPGTGYAQIETISRPVGGDYNALKLDASVDGAMTLDMHTEGLITETDRAVDFNSPWARIDSTYSPTITKIKVTYSGVGTMEAPVLLGFSDVTVSLWCREGRVPGVIKIKGQWLIPSDIKLEDINRPRKKNGDDSDELATKKAQEST